MEIVNTLDIDGTQWEIQDSDSREKIALLKVQLEQLKKETEEKEITTAVLNPDLIFSGHIIKKGRLVIVSGTLIASKIIEGVVIGGLPKNATKGNYRISLNWFDETEKSLNNAILVFDEGATDLVVGWNYQEAVIAKAGINMSYFTE